LGSPLPDLNPEELTRFRTGEALFNRVFSEKEGLGPLFNENQCSACHTSPVAGGTGDQLVIRASRSTPERCDALSNVGGDNVRTQATAALRARGVQAQPFPASATERAQLTAPFLFGLGLVEAIPERAILERADPEDRDHDGISGRAGRDASGQLARFGRKADVASLRVFTENALHLEMGLTSRARSAEGTLAGQPFPAAVDPATDPEVDDRTVESLVDFIRFLAPPARQPRATLAEQQTVQRGELLFHTAGCDLCHVPALPTGRHLSAALDRGRVFLYSDLLLHDLGPQLSNVCSLTATPNEQRTALLMGLGRRTVFLHDGRARDLTQAIQLHGGEAEPARQRFRGLNELDQARLIEFLRTL
jgi:CxxC motif-containing protein (DUF1111 family)